MSFGGRTVTTTCSYSAMKVLICLSLFAVTSYATYVGYPYVYRTALPQDAFYPRIYTFSNPIAGSKPFYPDVHLYRPYFYLGDPFLYSGLQPGGGFFSGAPTTIHIIPVPEEEGGDKKKPKKGKGKGGKEGKEEETTTMPPEKSEDIEKAEAKDEESGEDKSDSIEVESV